MEKTIKLKKGNHYWLEHEESFGRGFMYSIKTIPLYCEFIGYRGGMYYFYNSNHGLDILLTKEKTIIEIENGRKYENT